ncbi:MAG: hypothetical protein ACXWTP_00220 [Methylosarcina sp.]
MQGFAAPAQKACAALASVLTAGGVFFLPPPLPPGAAARGSLPSLWAAPGGPSAAPASGWWRLRFCSLRSVLGVFMAGFVSVPGFSRGAGIVARPLACGWAWARRSLPGGAGWSPAPACLFVPFGSFALASVFARAASALGWRVWLRSGASGSPVWSACGLPVPAFAVKVALPSGLSCRAACSALPAVPSFSALGALGV